MIGKSNQKKILKNKESICAYTHTEIEFLLFAFFMGFFHMHIYKGLSIKIQN